MNKNNNQEFSDKFKVAYGNLYKLHPSADNDEFRFRYLKVDWFFPNHLHNVLKNIQIFADKYFKDINVEIALYGGLFHDAGLVFERDSPDPKGHESRSTVYAEKELKNLGYDDNFIEKVKECIRATEPKYKTELQEALLVRNADSYAHVISMHFFAKSNFASDIHQYVDWFDRKVNSTFTKLTIPELIEEVSVLLGFYNRMIDNYKENKGKEGDIKSVII